MPTRNAFSLIELLVVVSVIALLMALLLPALEKARDAARIVVCANNERQILVALSTHASDNEGNFPPVSGYHPTTPNRVRRGVADFFDVLVPQYVEPPELWYCPDGPFSADTLMPPPPAQSTGDTFWDFVGSGGTVHPTDTSQYMPGHAVITQLVYVNLDEKGGDTDIARNLSDPGDWVVVTDFTTYDATDGSYTIQNHPGSPGNIAGWGLAPVVYGRTGLGGPVGINTATVDGSVRWTPAGEAMLGYPGGGGGPNYTFIRTVDPPRPGRPGMFP